MGASMALPCLIPGELLGFGPFPVAFLPALGGIVILYVAAAEAVKRWYFRGRRH
jgi:hypothetical protein